MPKLFVPIRTKAETSMFTTSKTSINDSSALSLEVLKTKAIILDKQG